MPGRVRREVREWILALDAAVCEVVNAPSLLVQRRNELRIPPVYSSPPEKSATSPPESERATSSSKP